MASLTDYEARIVREIAAWKAQGPSVYGKMTSRLTRPFARVLSRIVPRRAAEAAISTAYSTSDWFAGSDEMLRKGGVATLEELRHKSLELSDSLADQIGLGSQAVAFVDGAVTGAGGFMLAAVDVGALTVVALRAICRTGHCYGYALDRPQDRPYVLGVLMVAGTRTPAERLELLGRLEQVRTWALGETVEAVTMEGLAAQLVRLASLEAIPGIGALFGSAANVIFTRQVLTAARRIFEERWLLENGKIAEIPASS